jgi:2-polyprenyl-3-methyl-5-hydroxy-6-metoxy-1,4-benzoquinol methylase
MENWPENGLESVSCCPVCKSRNRKVLYDGLIDRVFFCAPGSWVLHQCEYCETAYLDPRPSPETVSLAYRNYFTHFELVEEHQPKGRLQRLRRALHNGYLNRRYGYSLTPSSGWGMLILPLFPRRACRAGRSICYLRLDRPGKRLLDIGCGNGAFISKTQALGWDSYGFEPDSEAIAVAQKSGLKVEQGKMPYTNFASNYFDIVTMNHVIEHLHDPVAALHEVYRILRPGGRIFISTPNINAQGHKIFGECWYGLDPPRHLMLFTPHSLHQACKLAGLAPEKPLKVPFWGYFSLLTSFRMTLGIDPHDNSVVLPRRLRRIAYLIDCKAFLGLQQGEEIVMFARKPA